MSETLDPVSHDDYIAYWVERRKKALEEVSHCERMMGSVALSKLDEIHVNQREDGDFEYTARAVR